MVKLEQDVFLIQMIVLHLKEHLINVIYLLEMNNNVQEQKVVKQEYVQRKLMPILIVIVLHIIQVVD